MLPEQPILTNVTAEDRKKLLMRAAGFPCESCGKSPAGGAGMFIPNSPWEFVSNAPRPGAVRIMIYPLCPECATPEKLGKLEEKWKSL